MKWLKDNLVFSVYLGLCFVVIFAIPVIFLGAPVELVTLLPLSVTVVTFLFGLLTDLAQRITWGE